MWGGDVTSACGVWKFRIPPCLKVFQVSNLHRRPVFVSPHQHTLTRPHILLDSGVKKHVLSLIYTSTRTMSSSKKSPPANVGAPDLSILGDRLTLHPPSVASSSSSTSGSLTPSTPSSQSASSSSPSLSVSNSSSPDDNANLPLDPSTAPEQPLLTSYARFRTAPFDFLRELSAHVSGTGWRSYDRICGQEIFYKGFSERMKSNILRNPKLVAKIRDLAARRVDVEIEQGLVSSEDAKSSRNVQLETQLTELAEQWSDGMICKMESKRFIRGAYYLCTQLLTRAYHQGNSHLLASFFFIMSLLVYSSRLHAPAFLFRA